MNKKKMIAFLLTLVMVCSVAAPFAFAADEGIQPHYTRILTFDIDLDIASNDKSTSYSKVTASHTDKINLTMELQREVDGEWETIKTWSTSNTWIASMEKDWYVGKGYDYQVLATADVYNANGVWQETVSEVSFVVHH